MSKRALLIGINYIGTINQLFGCIYDVIQIKSLLIDVYGFEPSNIITLRDDDPSNLPTCDRIRKELNNIVKANSTYNFIYYSGHGINIIDKSGDEIDKNDECICPSDCVKNGLILDDEINKIIKPIKGACLCLFDCCRSGTIMDLPYTGINPKSIITDTNAIICISGCRDDQLSSETYAHVPGLPQGAMTAAAISVLRKEKYYPTMNTFITKLNMELKNNGFSQIPIITSSKELSNNTPFPFPRNSEILALQDENNKLKKQLLTLSSTITSLRRSINVKK
jgi:hypothetical protein